MYDDIWAKVVGGTYRKSPAFVRGYSRKKITNQVYPCIVPGSAQNTVWGALYFDVDAADKIRLDAFEGAYYTGTAVNAFAGRATPTEAFAYVLSEKFSFLAEAEEWDESFFLSNGNKESFISGYQGFKT